MSGNGNGIVEQFKLEDLVKRLELLKEAKFTGNVTVEYNMKNGGVGGVFIQTRERM